MNYVICPVTQPVERFRALTSHRFVLADTGLGTTLDDGQKIKNYFSSFRDFSGKNRWYHIVVLQMYYKPTKYNQNCWSHFFIKSKVTFIIIEKLGPWVCIYLITHYETCPKFLVATMMIMKSAAMTFCEEPRSNLSKISSFFWLKCFVGGD